MAKNRNGMGSIRQRKDGRFEARYTGADGKQHSIFGHSVTEVSKKLRAATSSVDTGDWLSPNRLTVSDWFNVWLSDYCSQLRSRTQSNYKLFLDKASKVIGNLRLSVITPAHIQRVITEAQKEGLSSGTVHLIQGTLHNAFGRAVENKLINANPVEKVKPVKRIASREMHIIDRPLFPAFFKAAKETPYSNELLFLLLTGIRISELIGLTWDNVNLDSSEIKICQQIVSNADGFAVSPTKSGETRIIKIVPEAIEILRIQKIQQKEDRIKSGSAWITGYPHDGLVFRMPEGRHIQHRCILRHVHNVGAKIGIPELHTHDLRHSYAVAALRSGIDVKTVQHNLGHSSATITLDVYARYTDDAGETAARILSEYFQTALEN